MAVIRNELGKKSIWEEKEWEEPSKVWTVACQTNKTAGTVKRVWLSIWGNVNILEEGRSSCALYTW